MSNLPGHNFSTFRAAAARLRELGHEVVSPHEIAHAEVEPGLGELPWTTYMRRDIAELLTCDAIILLPGWAASRGAQFELDVARRLDMRVFYYDAEQGLIEGAS